MKEKTERMYSFLGREFNSIFLNKKMCLRSSTVQYFETIFHKISD